MLDRRLRLALASATAMAGFTASPLAFAQDVDHPDTEEQIVVTAQKRETLLQETPLAITALGGEALEERGVQTAADLAMFVPGADFSTNGGSTSITIRGVGSDGLAQAKDDPSVAAHLDGVYLPRPASLASLLYDIERVEVLRGPQGTLYGRNSTGGAMNIITRQPTGEYEGSFEAALGNFESREFRGVINLPIAGEKLALRLSGIYNTHDGYSPQLNPLFEDGDDADDFAVRATLAWRPSDDFTLTLRANLFYSDAVGPSRTPIDTTSLIGVADANGVPYGSSTGQIFVDRSAIPGFPQAADPRVIETAYPQAQYLRSNTYSATIDWDISDAWSLRSITGFTDFVQDKDSASRPFLPLFVNSTFDYRTFSEAYSQEVNLNYDAGGRFSFVAGAFFLHDQGGNPFDSIPFNPVFFVTIESDQFVTTESTAVFGEANFKLTDALTLTGGIRYTEDEKRGGSETHVIVPFVGPISAPLRAETSFDSTDYKIGLDWDITEDVFAYVNYSTAFKTGGFNTGLPVNLLYEPEEIGAWQFGLKSDWADGRFRLNVDGYIYDYDNPQITQVLGVSLETQNADSAEVKGLEVSAELRPTDALSLTGYVAYADSEYADSLISDIIDVNAFGQNVFGQIQIGGNPLRYTPEWSAGGSLAYTWTMAPGELTARTDVHWQDDSYARPHALPVDLIEAYAIYNASLRFTSDRGYFLEAFGKNLSDELIVSARFVNPLHTVEYRPPRTWGVKLGMSFN